MGLLLWTLILPLGLGLFLFGAVVYNLFFHPYAKYPGPFLARISPLHNLYHAARKDLHLDIQRCHEIYGPLVRYAPNRLLFCSAKAYLDIFGQGKNTQKSIGYNAHPYYNEIPNLNNCINKKAHRRKQRLVLGSMNSDLTMQHSNHFALEQARKFCDILLEGTSSDSVHKTEWSVPREMAVWTNYFTLDVISGLILGQPLNLMSCENVRWLVNAFFDGNHYMYYRMAWPSFFNSRFARITSLKHWLFPRMKQEGIDSNRLCNDLWRQRSLQEKHQGQNDIVNTMRSVLDPNTGRAYPDEEIWHESLLLIRAGGDTTSAALASFFFYLSRNPACYTRLAHEIRSTFSSVDEIVWGDALLHCRYLRACLDEALRLGPPAAGAFWREVSPGGAMIDGTHVPAGCEVSVGVYAINHKAEYYPEPYAFRPGRFLDSNHKIPEGAFAPFSLGPRVCPARVLSYHEMSILCALVFYRMDFRPVDSMGEGGHEDGWGRHRKHEYQIYDQFSSNKYGPLLHFRPRVIQESQQDGPDQHRRGSWKYDTLDV